MVAGFFLPLFADSKVMAKIVPFKAIRPTRDKAHLVASRPVYTYKRRILNAKLDTNPYTFMHIIMPEYKQADKTHPNSRDRFRKVRSQFNLFRNEGILIEEERPCLYVYRQWKGDVSYTGLIAGVSIDDYFGGSIKKHEQTLTKREAIFRDYLDICEFNAEPVLLTYPDNRTVSNLIALSLSERPEYDFTNTDRIRHQLWLVDDPEDIATLTNAFQNFDSIYIADGHHRTASSALLGKERRDEGIHGMHEYFMAFFMPESQLDIYDFNRVVKDLNGLNVDAFLARLEESFEVEPVNESKYRVQKLHEFGLYLDGRWFRLTCKPGTFDANDPVGSLDAEILTQNVLNPILNIRDLKTDKRIQFVGGLEGTETLEQQVDKGRMAAAFALFPVSTTQLKAVADAGRTMPPKSTWIEPKLRSGLTIFKL